MSVVCMLKTTDVVFLAGGDDAPSRDGVLSQGGSATAVVTIEKQTKRRGERMKLNRHCRIGGGEDERKDVETSPMLISRDSVVRVVGVLEEKRTKGTSRQEVAG